MRNLIAIGAAVAATAWAGVARAQEVSAALPQDLSPWGMVSHADWVVKAVLAGLAFASVATWTVALAKAAELLATGRRNAGGLAALQGAASLAAATPRGFCGTLVEAARAELQASAPADHRPLDGPARDGVKERTALKLERLVAGSSRALNRGTGILATIGATAPFVGLFGTVWGIMNSFIGISRSQTTNLAVVAPGIAEALLATAIGLVAAIPAVVIYNFIARVISAQRARLQDAAAETLRLLSRDLDLARPMPAERARPVAAA